MEKKGKQRLKKLLKCKGVTKPGCILLFFVTVIVFKCAHLQKNSDIIEGILSVLLQSVAKIIIKITELVIFVVTNCIAAKTETKVSAIQNMIPAILFCPDFLV